MHKKKKLKTNPGLKYETEFPLWKLAHKLNNRKREIINWSFELNWIKKIEQLVWS